MFRTMIVTLGVVGLFACGGEPEPAGPPAGFPDDTDARAGHCRHVLYLTLERMEEFAGSGPAHGFLAQRGTTDVQRALDNAADAYEGYLAEPGTREHVRQLSQVIELMDEDDTGELSSRSELDTFNAHVNLCLDLFLLDG